MAGYEVVINFGPVRVIEIPVVSTNFDSKSPKNLSNLGINNWTNHVILPVTP